MDKPVDAGSHRRLSLAVVGAVAIASLGFVVVPRLDGLSLAAACGPGGEVLRVPGQPDACVHADETPPGVDVSEPVPTRELKARPGAGAAAHEAAEELGVPSAVESTGTGPSVPCDGDGDSGYRVQAMYVVESTKANRYADLLPSMRRWAAGVDDVFNRSAALTGGVRHLRYVTEPGADGCVASVLNVTVPAGATSSFGATVQAVQALGYTDRTRKYLLWTDASVLCGVASMYTTDNPAQSNTNNGSYAQYARVDSGCWGLGNGTTQISVEAHELVHNFGGVQSTAPHATRAGHCWDDADTLCYNDGGGFTMRQICPPEREFLLDCNSDDYFSTLPEPGSYLDTRWNSANTRFLIGGGDGSNGGSTGTPTTLGARISVNNPAVPGLITQVSVAPTLPPGRTVTSVTWKSARPDCTFATPTELQSTVQCPATVTAPTTVTASLVDSSGATKSVSSPLTFATGTNRPVAVTLSAAGQSPTAQLCTSAPSPLTATLTDTASGQPVKGVPAVFTRRTATMPTAASAGSKVTGHDGTATVTATATAATTYGAASSRSGVYAAAAPVSLEATVARCSLTVSAAADTTDLFHGDPVAVTGTLERAVGGASVGVAGVSVPVTLTTRTTAANGAVTIRTTNLGTARTDAAGAYRVLVRPTQSGTLGVSVPGSVSYDATSRTIGEIQVRLPQTQLAAAADRTDVGYGETVTVTGTLRRTAGAATTNVAGQSVTLKVTPPGKPAATVGTGRTLTDGSYRIAAPIRVAGAMSAVYAGSAGLPAATVPLGDVTVGTWTPALSASYTRSSTAAGSPVTLTGTVNRSYGGRTGPAAGVPLRVTVQAEGATTSTTLSVSTNASGVYTLRVSPRATTTYTVRLVLATGYTPAEAAPVRVAVG